MIEALNISYYIQPYMPRYVFTEYYQHYFELSLIDIIYHYFNNQDLYDKHSITYKNVKDFLSYHNSCNLTCDVFDDIYEPQEMNEIDLQNAKCFIERYNVELNRVENIYRIFEEIYQYDGQKDYKNSHLSYELGKRNTMSRCNIKEFMKNNLCKEYVENKIQNKFNNKKINDKHKSIIFALDIIDKLFDNYIKSLKYGIDVLKNRPYIMNYGEEYLPKIYQNNFIEKYKTIYIKHLGFINNILKTNGSKEKLLNKGYVKIFIPRQSKKIDIWFE